MGRIAITTGGVKQSLSNYNALKSICEYIWNGFDAGANRIEITTSRNNLSGISEISIKDNGIGIAKKQLNKKFKPFYESEKAEQAYERTRPVCTRLIREIHKILMQGVRGEYKTPGEFRISQNWIGGSMPSTAVYVPPPHTEVAECLTDFEKFINNEEIDTPDLIKIAILHYQFESIHPFLDGNGRIGRLLIPLYIQSKGMLDKSCLYISDYIERNKDTYYDMLTRVRTHNDMISWIKFFLEAVIETSKTAKEKFRKVVELTLEMDRIIMDLPVKPENAKKVLEVLYNEPIVSRKKIIENTGMRFTTLVGVINALQDKNILIETTGYSRNQVFAFQRYIDLFLK